jgi:hypothetical protein
LLAREYLQLFARHAAGLERCEVTMTENFLFERLKSGPDFLEQLACVGHGPSLLTPRMVKSLRIWLANAARAERYFQADAVVPDGLSKQPESGFPVVRRKSPVPVKNNSLFAFQNSLFR